MGLRDYVPERAKIETKSTTFSVRGLALPDVTRLIMLHLSDIELAVTRFHKIKEQQYSRQALDEFLLGLSVDFPDLVAEVISVAADEPSPEDEQMTEADRLEALQSAAAKLPLGLQTQCLVEIVRLTFEEAGGIKNLFASLVANLQVALPEDFRLAMAARMTMGPPSKSSIGASAET